MRDSSRISQFFANFQSRITVSGEIFSTSAVSSTLNPPKNRSSTTWAFRSYCAASARSASSMAIRSSGVSLATGRFWSNVTRWSAPPRFWLFARPGEIDEHAAHQPGGHREEVRAILPLDPPDINQPEVDLVDERGGLEHVVRTLAGHVPLRDASQLAVDEREQLLDGPVVARSPFDEKGGHVARARRLHDFPGSCPFDRRPSLRPAHSTPRGDDSCCRRFAPPSPTRGFGPQGGTP